MKLAIASYCSITQQSVSQNGQEINFPKSDGFASFAKDLYKQMELSYSKFFKMDELCKLAFLATEVLLEDQKTSDWDGEKVAIVLGNRTSSGVTDQKHYESFSNREAYFPSPAVFVYTLPNIMLGELCIRHKINGENSCFLMQDFDAEFFYDYVGYLFDNEDYDYCITGWVDYQPLEHKAHLFLVTKQNQPDTGLIFNKNFKQHIH